MRERRNKCIREYYERESEREKEARKNGKEIGENVRAWTVIARICTSDYKELTKNRRH